MTVSPQRRDLVEKARQGWIKRLIDLSRRNNLLYYRPLKMGTLDLSDSNGDRMAALLKGDSVSVSSISREEIEDRLPDKLIQIWRKAVANAEEKGLETLYLVLGIASWTAQDGGRNPEAPVLLLPVSLEPKGRSGQSFQLHRTGTVQVNLVLLHALRTEFGVDLSPESLIQLLQGDDEGEIYDPSPVYDYLALKSRAAPEFHVKPAAILGNFAFQKMAMVNELSALAEELASHELIAALAGDIAAKISVQNSGQNPDPAEFDKLPPEVEFLVQDADSSQQAAIAGVLAGQSAVIHGPPGTGKSQTITNLIAALTATARTTLFVAEKRAALEVVQDRLKSVGLPHLAIDLHGADVSPKRVLKQIAAALESVRLSSTVDCDAMHQRFVERRNRLNRHVERLHHKRPPSDLNVYQLQGLVLNLSATVSSTTRWRGKALDQIVKAGVDNVRALFNELTGFASLFLRTDASPWTGSILIDGREVEKAIDLTHHLSQDLWPRFDDVLNAAIDSAKFRKPNSLREARQILDLFAGVSKTLALYVLEIFSQDFETLLLNLRPGCAGVWSAFWHWLTNAGYRQARRAVLNLRKSGKAPVPQIVGELSVAREQLQEWHKFNAAPSHPFPVPSLPQFSQRLEALAKDLAELQTVFPSNQFDTLPLDDLRELLKSLALDSLTPHRIPKLLELEAGLEKAGMGKLVTEIRIAKIEVDKWVSLFDHAWFSSCLDSAFAEDPALAGFNGRVHDQFAEEFANLDKERISVASARVRRVHAQKAITAMNAYPDQDALVRSETQKKTRHIALRSLFAGARDVLTAICPCWMASPLSVSQLLDPHTPFNAVIFDEASQILPEDAVTSVLRGTQIVVAGDPHQLPPTTFFAALDDEENSEEEISASEGFESLLDIANTFVPSRYLAWHYRSRDEALIAFSNHHIYGDRLVTFPGPGGPPVVTHVLVDQPVGVDGPEESSSAEVKNVVDLVIEQARTRPHESLGVIAMGIRHADRVQGALDNALQAHPELDPFFDPGRKERFFVKNLERVQGDERDAIILTIGYGKDRGGNLPFRFGPLLSQGGQRRLNVAVTRARNRMMLVSSFSHLDMNPTKVRPGTGVELLRNYLLYASTTGKLLADVAPSEVPLNMFEMQVFDVLKGKGIPLIPQVGASRFRIDFVAQHPNQPGRFVLAIECDGASYHSSPTARDRDRLRQQQLENLGWRFLRIWSTDWFMRKDAEIERVMKAYKDAVERADRVTAIPRKTDAPAPSAGESADNRRDVSQSRRGPRPPIRYKDMITQYSVEELMTLIRWINADGQLRTDSELVSEMVSQLGFTRRGARIEVIVREAIEMLRRSNLL